MKRDTMACNKRAAGTGKISHKLRSASLRARFWTRACGSLFFGLWYSFVACLQVICPFLKKFTCQEFVFCFYFLFVGRLRIVCSENNMQQIQKRLRSNYNARKKSFFVCLSQFFVIPLYCIMCSFKGYSYTWDKCSDNIAHTSIPWLWFFPCLQQTCQKYWFCTCFCLALLIFAVLLIHYPFAIKCGLDPGAGNHVLTLQEAPHWT